MTASAFQDRMVADFEISRPLLDGDEIRAILAQTEYLVQREVGPGRVPTTILDLEQLQLADYAAFADVGEEQRDWLRRVQEVDPIRTEEMVYLTLRSLIDVQWEPPQSNDDLRRALMFGDALDWVLRGKARELSPRFETSDARLPYWGRCSFLRVLDTMPRNCLERLRPEQLAFALIKRPKFNASTTAVAGGFVVGMNWALEPILKTMNRFLLHYFHTDAYAGPERLARAWQSIAAAVLFFWSDVDAMRVPTPTSMFFDGRVARLAHTLTADQVDFIVSHELGHVALDHPRSLDTGQSDAAERLRLRHELEFEADAFAYACRHAGGAAASAQTRRRRRRGIDLYVKSLSHDQMPADSDLRLDATHILFTYMDFVDRCGRMLTTRLGAQLGLRAQMDSHPTAAMRLHRLANGRPGTPHASALTQYAEKFFRQLFDHVAGIDEDALWTSLTRRSYP